MSKILIAVIQIVRSRGETVRARIHKSADESIQLVGQQHYHTYHSFTPDWSTKLKYEVTYTTQTYLLYICMD